MPRGKKLAKQIKLTNYVGFFPEKPLPTVSQYLNFHPYREDMDYLLEVKSKCQLVCLLYKQQNLIYLLSLVFSYFIAKYHTKFPKVCISSSINV